MGSKTSTTLDESPQQTGPTAGVAMTTCIFPTDAPCALAQDYVHAPASESNEITPAWYVYALSSETEEDNPFYIGITTNLRQRALAHDRSRDSSAYDRIQAYEALGVWIIMAVLAQYPTKAEARAYETTLIALRPLVLNRDVAACTRALLRSFVPDAP